MSPSIHDFIKVSIALSQLTGAASKGPLAVALSCGIKISAVYHLVLSQSTRVTDRRTERITTPKTALT